MLLMYAQNDVKDDFPSTKAEKGGGHTILFFCRQFVRVRLEIQKSTTRGLQESKPKLSAGTPGGEKIRHSDSDS
ncbi:hypothetical protein TNCV_2352001 [Trichonephila clavipes]|nr:hypothetical protein TNCV_2352001 [Trichonephila clavipes]